MSARVTADMLRSRRFAEYAATLRVSPQTPIAGFETELVLALERGGGR